MFFSLPPRTKKILLILGFFAFIVAMGWLIYFLFFRVAPTPQVSAPAGVATGQLPKAGAGQPKPSTGIIGYLQGLPSSLGLTTPSLPAPTPMPPLPSRFTNLSVTSNSSISIDPSGSGVRAYNAADGKFYSISDNGSSIAIAPETFLNVQNVIWGSGKNQAILEFPDGVKVYEDFQTGKTVTLPKHWTDFSFSPQGTQIAAKSIGEDETNRFLVIANPDGTDPKPVEELGSNQDRVKVSWSPNNQVIAFSNTADARGFDETGILLLGKNQENFKQLVVQGQGFIPNWSPNGSQLLYSVWSSWNDYRPMLWVSDAAPDTINNHRRMLKIATWADKCAWKSEDVLLCAIPGNIQANSGLQRNLFDTGPDFIFKIDLRTGAQTNLGQFDGGVARQITVSQNGNSAYIVNTDTGFLSKLDLTSL